jgi:hypothetical protein
MPSSRHDAINEFFTDDPGVVVEALSEFLGIKLPNNLPVRVEDTQFNDRPSTDFRADAVITVGPPRNPAHAIIVEIQQRGSLEKRRQIPRYAAMAWLTLRCPITVLVVCPSTAAAAWYRKPVETNLPGYTFAADVLGPEEIPVLTDPKEITANPNLAALKMMAHGHLEDVREVFVKGLEGLPYDYAMKYYGHVQRMTAGQTGRKLEELVKETTVYSDLVREHQALGEARGQALGEARGQALGEAKALLLTLSARGISVSEEARTRITTCEDLGQLDTWVRRAVTAESVEDLFQ